MNYSREQRGALRREVAGGTLLNLNLRVALALIEDLEETDEVLVDLNEKRLAAETDASCLSDLYRDAKKLLAEARWLLENDKSDWLNGEFACCDYCDAQWSARKRDYVHKPNCEYVAWDTRLGAFLKATEEKTNASE